MPTVCTTRCLAGFQQTTAYASNPDHTSLPTMGVISKPIMTYLTKIPHVFKASLNGSHEKMKEYSARQLKKKILQEPQITQPRILRVLPALLDNRTSMALIVTIPSRPQFNASCDSQ
jgi:hypothetical protein